MFIFTKILSIINSTIASVLSVLVVSIPGGLTAYLTGGCRSNPLSVYSYSLLEPTVKLTKDAVLPKSGSVTMYLAKNESEYCQIAVRARDGRKNTYFEISDFTDEKGNTIPVEVYSEYAVETYGKPFNTKYYDALVPAEKSFTLNMRTGLNYVFAVRIKTDSDTAAGDYKATVKFGNAEADGNKYENESVEINAHIWNFTLPDAPAMDTAMGIERYDIALVHGVSQGSAERDELYKKYYDFLLDRGVSGYDLPYDILDDRADAYMSNPRVKSFRIPYGSDEQITAYYNKLSKNAEWFKKGYFYPIDEPHSPENIQSYNAICERLSRLFPGYHMVTPFYTNNIDGVEESNLKIQEGKSDIICPETVIFSEEGFGDAVKSRVASGDKVWWYVCCGPSPTSDYCNLFVQQSSLIHRILFWQQKQYDVTGLLYWDTTYWRDVQFPDGTHAKDPWESAWTTPWTGDDTFGDGSLLYNGNHIGIDGPVSSLRLECVSNGIEDYEYLTIAEKYLGKEAVDKIIGKVSANLTDFTYSDKAFLSARIELGNAVEKATCK